MVASQLGMMYSILPQILRWQVKILQKLQKKDFSAQRFASEKRL
jgi:hypothetical protein